MTSEEIASIRLNSQKIAQSEFKTAGDVVGWMGAIQAQDAVMSLWAIGIRMRNPLKQNIDEAINNGDILRIHVLRPTWHFIRAEDIYWMLDLSAPKILSSLKSRHRVLELSGTVIAKCHKIIEKSLSEAGSLTRQELGDLFIRAGISTDGNRLSHILFEAELNRMICSGPFRDDKQTYSLLSERVPEIKKLTRDESLAELALRYFKSRFPATIGDFVWWSNLSLTDARKAADYLKSDFSIETIGETKYYLPHSFKGNVNYENSAFLLPAYDEFLISYRDRNCSLSAVHNKKAVSDNGIFYPVIVVNGQAEGTWKRRVQKDKVVISPTFFQPADKSLQHQLKQKAKIYGDFLNKKAEIELRDG
jgi:hypothetical protein